MDAIIALFSITEVLVLCLGSFVWLRRNKNPYPVTAAIALGIAAGLTYLSFIFQIGFLAGFPQIIPLLECISLIGIVWINWGKWEAVADIRNVLFATWRESPRVFAILAIALTYLFLQAVLLPPSSWDALTYHLPRVLLWEQNRSLFLQDFTITPQATFPVGSDILYHTFLRFQIDYGLGYFSWLSYITILFGTYALVRPYVSHWIALTTAITIICLPEIVYQSTGTKNDIILAAVALTSTLWAERWRLVASLESLIGLGLTICFGIAVKTSFVLFAFFFLTVWFSLVIQEGRLPLLLNSLRKKWKIIMLYMVPGLVLSQSWLFIYNYRQFGEWLGPAEFAFQNQNNDGLLGTIANLVRYSFQSIHLLQPVDGVVKALTGASIVSGLQSIYDALLNPLFGNAGQAEFIKWQPFEIKWQPQEDTSWFGPLSLFLIYPSVAWCLVKGKKLSRMMAIVTIALVLAISYKIGWSPWKARFFTLVLVCTGPCIAIFLQRFQPKNWLLSGIRWLSMAILVYACLYNYAKPIIPSADYLSRENIWIRSNWTRDRYVYDRLYRGNQIEDLNQALLSAQKVAIVGYDHYFSVMFHNPEIRFTLLSTDSNTSETQSLDKISDRIAEVDHLICFEKQCDIQRSNVSLDLVWENDSEDKTTQIYRVLSTRQ